MRTTGLCLLALLFCGTAHAATATISDSIDIKHIALHLDITDYAGQSISGTATVTIAAKVDGITHLPLDLMIDGVTGISDDAAHDLLFTHIGEQLDITLFAPLNTADEVTITIAYAGEPAQDGSWGGWYWNGDYSYQLGVGFDAIPHNYGRAWFPCFDNFVERSTYDFSITTSADKKAFCNGLLQDSLVNGDGTITWNWNCAQTIPSYLASVAVSTYATVYDTHAGIDRTFPIQFAAKPEDTTDMKNSFVNLHGALETFETHYGPYAWDRVGFTVVPFNAGAMEHSMNIAYPLFAVNGLTTWETLYAHELSHQWWGDLVTTSKAEEMWLNEGWAVFSEHLFTEAIYGREAYLETVNNNFLDVIHYAAANDGNNYFAISDVPQTHTYGATTYNKGASVVHSLRGYLGDDVFFSCINSFLEENKFTDITAAELRDHLSACSGKDMTDFFEDWVYQPGFLGFEIDALGEQKGSIYSICIQQKGKHVNHLGQNVPLTIYGIKTDGTVADSIDIMMSGEKMMFDWTPAELSSFFVIDYRDKLNDATTSDLKTISEAGDYDMEHALIDLEVTSFVGEGTIYAEHHWVAADGFKLPHPGLHVNTQRYWRVVNELPAATAIEVFLDYNGQLTTGGGYLDNEFITGSEDSLVLLYRNTFDSDWQILTDAVVNPFGSKIDKRGRFELTSLPTGEYAIGMYDHTLPDMPLDTNSLCADYTGISNNAPEFIRVFPNPSNTTLQVEVNPALLNNTIILIDSAGRIVWSGRISQANMSISIATLPAGTYQLYVENSRSERIAAEKVLIIH